MKAINLLSGRIVKVCLAMLAAVVAVGASGCVSVDKYNEVLAESRERQTTIQSLLAAQEQDMLNADRAKFDRDSMRIKYSGCEAKLAAMKRELAQRKAMIDALTRQVGTRSLPESLSTALSEWAMQTGSDMVSYDAEAGMVRFKSDLLFDAGSVTVKNKAATQLKGLAGILNSAAAEGFDILIVGHTDDQPIKASIQRHPTNWHLSAHRAISVEKILAGAGITSRRMAVVGMGEFRPIVPNKAGQKGQSKNRRVELYIVPATEIHAGG